MIYLDIMVCLPLWTINTHFESLLTHPQIYNCSLGPLPWVYVPEIFPTRIRALGLASSMLAD